MFHDPEFEDFDDDTDYRGRKFSNGHPLTDLKLIGPFLDQPIESARWCGAGGSYIEVARMGASHAAATINFLLRRAQDIAVVHLLSQGKPPISYDTSLDARDARAWLLGTNLVIALVARALAGGEAKAQFPWERGA